MEAYRRNIDILITNNDRELAEKETLIFNEYIDKFSHFYKDNLLEETPSFEGNPDIEDSVPFSESDALENTTDDKIKDSILAPEQ